MKRSLLMFAADDHGQLCGPTSRLRDANELSIWYRRP